MLSVPHLLHAQLISHFMSGKMDFVCGLCACIFRDFLLLRGEKEDEEVREKPSAVFLQAEKRLKRQDIQMEHVFLHWR